MDTTRNIGYIKVFFFLFFLIPLEKRSDELINISDFQNNNINQQKFNRSLDQNCRDKSFYRNLSTHPTYPKFGDVEMWKKFCREFIKTNNQKNFISQNLKINSLSENKGILTGYYQPLLKVSFQKSSLYKYPILKKGEHLMIPRAQIHDAYEKNDVLCWAQSDIEIFFLQIQGSGLGLLKSGKMVKISYSGNNGYKYTSIGKVLVEKSFLKKSGISAQKIKQWLENNPQKKNLIFNYNRRFIFFELSDFDNTYPKGSSNRELIPRVSLAIDNNIYPYGIPMLTLTEKEEYNLMVLTHDTGSAIRGKNRGDLFLGRGKKAGIEAGMLSEELKILYLTPN